MDKIEKERNNARKLLSKKIMPLVGSLLDAWDNIPNDTKYDEEFEELANVIEQIGSIMDDDNE
jgi:hypothetical protein